MKFSLKSALVCVCVLNLLLGGWQFFLDRPLKNDCVASHAGFGSAAVDRAAAARVR